MRLIGNSLAVWLFSKTCLALNVSSHLHTIWYIAIANVEYAARYFRPPYGTIGARTRQRLASLIDDPYIINWSVDIEDWLYANSDTPEKQFEAFKRDVRRGGNLAVMHYLHPTTVGYFRDVINVAKAAGKQIMRVDQCMEDPDAPPLPGDRGSSTKRNYQETQFIDRQWRW